MSERDDTGRFLPGHSSPHKGKMARRIRQELAETLDALGYDLISDIVACIRDPETPKEWANRLRIALLQKLVPSYAAIAHTRSSKSEVSVKIEAALVQNPAAAALAEQAVFKALGLDTPKGLLRAPIIDAEVISDGTDNDADQHQSPDQPE